MQIKTTIPVSVSIPPQPATCNLQPATEAASNCLDFIASDSTTDRYSESIVASGWKLDNYRRNPVFQNSHQYGDILFTLGKALITEVREVGRGVPTAPHPVLFQRIQFACDINPMAKIAYGLYKSGFLHGVSVGFVPLKWEDAPSARNADLQSAVSQVSNLPPETTPLSCSAGEGQGEGAQPLSAPAANKLSTMGSRTSANSLSTRTDGVRRRYVEQELLEVSAVAIPANPNALALAYKSGAVEKSDLRELSDLLRCTLSAHGVPASAGSPSSEPQISNPEMIPEDHLKFFLQLRALMQKV